MPKKNELPLTRYLVSFEGTLSGPFTLAQLQVLWRKGEFDPTSQVAKDGDQAHWRPITEMKATLDPSIHCKQARTTLEEGARRRRNKGEQPDKKDSNHTETMTTVLLAGILVAVIVVVVLVTYLAGNLL